MSTKTTVLIARILLGLIYFVFGLNFFLHFIPQGSSPTGNAGAFVGGLFQSGYLFPLIKVIEVVCGALLLFGRYIPLVLIVLMPISINIFLFHTILLPGAAPVTISFLIIISQLYLAWCYRSYYKQLFVAKATL
jgi:putative oxidoreductase